MKRFHVMMKVQHLQDSINFYSALLGAEPTVLKADYAKWLINEPALNLSISQTTDAPGIEHLGLQVETEEDMAVLRVRADQAEGKQYNEGHTTCCYAKSDKTWIKDPQDISWELFRSYGQSETYRGAQEENLCCK